MQEYSVYIYDNTMQYNTGSTVDVGEYIKLDIFNKGSVVLPIKSTKIKKDNSIKITFGVPEYLYDDFVNNGENDFYDIHLERVIIDNVISAEWVW